MDTCLRFVNIHLKVELLHQLHLDNWCNDVPQRKQMTIMRIVEHNTKFSRMQVLLPSRIDMNGTNIFTGICITSNDL